MKLAISNIAWDSTDDLKAYQLMKKYGFEGLEIAPTRFFAHNPYDRSDECRQLAKQLKIEYNFDVCSMQSILFGRDEKIFESPENTTLITQYLFKAIDFATAARCGNIVFGCPKNKGVIDADSYSVAVDFFRVLGQYAAKRHTIVAIEPNPAMYGTNFINYTKEAVELAKEVGSDGIKVNADLGTIIVNSEDVEEISKNIKYINHIHISEPELMPVRERSEHRQLASFLRQEEYNGFISIEMRGPNNIYDIEKVMQYIAEVFKG